MVSPEMLLAKLPPYRDEWELITPRQYVPEIIAEVMAAHRLFGGYYDQFSYMFYTPNPSEIAERLYAFCKQHIRYKEEGVKTQTTALPTGILSRGYGDCKHYALFIAGVISSLNRLYGCCFDAAFVFAGYGRAKEAHHVFVSVYDPVTNEQIWVDPTPGSGGTPSILIGKPV